MRQRWTCRVPRECKHRHSRAVCAREQVDQHSLPSQWPLRAKPSGEKRTVPRRMKWQTLFSISKTRCESNHSDPIQPGFLRMISWRQPYLFLNNYTLKLFAPQLLPKQSLSRCLDRAKRIENIRRVAFLPIEQCSLCKHFVNHKSKKRLKTRASPDLQCSTPLVLGGEGKRLLIESAGTNSRSPLTPRAVRLLVGPLPNRIGNGGAPQVWGCTL